MSQTPVSTAVGFACLNVLSHYGLLSGECFFHHAAQASRSFTAAQHRRAAVSHSFSTGELTWYSGIAVSLTACTLAQETLDEVCLRTFAVTPGCTAYLRLTTSTRTACVPWFTGSSCMRKPKTVASAGWVLSVDTPQLGSQHRPPLYASTASRNVSPGRTYMAGALVTLHEVACCRLW